jgi:hypothetical protein
MQPTATQHTQAAKIVRERGRPLAVSCVLCNTCCWRNTCLALPSQRGGGLARAAPSVAGPSKEVRATADMDMTMRASCGFSNTRKGGVRAQCESECGRGPGVEKRPMSLPSKCFCNSFPASFSGGFQEPAWIGVPQSATDPTEHCTRSVSPTLARWATPS